MYTLINFISDKIKQLINKRTFCKKKNPLEINYQHTHTKKKTYQITAHFTNRKIQIGMTVFYDANDTKFVNNFIIKCNLLLFNLFNDNTCR